MNALVGGSDTQEPVVRKKLHPRLKAANHGIKDTPSDMKRITCSVLQSSMRGPLVFLLYINDIVSVSYVLFYSQMTLHYFADQNIYMNYA